MRLDLSFLRGRQRSRTRGPIRWSLLALASVFGGLMNSAQAVEITITCGPSGSDVEFCLKHAQAWAAKTGHTVKNFSPPTSPTEKLALYRQLFAAKSPDIDVVQIDTAWPGVLKDHLLDLKPYSRGAEAQHFPAIIANNTVGGRLVGMPLTGLSSFCASAQA